LGTRDIGGEETRERERERERDATDFASGPYLFASRKMDRRAHEPMTRRYQKKRAAYYHPPVVSFFPLEINDAISPNVGSAKQLRKLYPRFFFTTIHLFPSLYKFLNNQVPRYSREDPDVS
jgi:hypothetical protein